MTLPTADRCILPNWLGAASPVLAAVLLILGFASARAQEAQQQIRPQGWQPDISATVSRLKDALQEESAQQGINRLSREIADLLDAQLFIVYTRLSERLSPRKREQLSREQARWLSARSKHAEAAIESEGGSLAAFEANDAEATFTAKRIEELQRRLSAMGHTERSKGKASEE